MTHPLFEYEYLVFFRFCRENLSRAMWLNYADRGNGVQIGINKDIVSSSSLKEHNPDVFVQCVYMTKEESEDKERVKAAIKRVYDKYEFESDNFQDDLSVCASCLKQEEVRRYLAGCAYDLGKIEIRRIEDKELV